MSHAQQPVPKRRSTMLVERAVGLVLAFTMLWALVMIVFGLLTFGAGFPTDLAWGKCHVTGAAAEQTPDDDAPWRIVVESTDCPPLVYTDGVHEDNAAQLAQTLDEGLYEMRVHESAIDADGRSVRWARELTLHSYRPAPDIAE